MALDEGSSPAAAFWARRDESRVTGGEGGVGGDDGRRVSETWASLEQDIGGTEPPTRNTPYFHSPFSPSPLPTFSSHLSQTLPLSALRGRRALPLQRTVYLQQPLGLHASGRPPQ